MNILFDALPGTAMPVPEVTRQIAAMWREEDAIGDKNLFNAHALQMNLIVHLGLDTKAEEGRNIFDQAIEFSQRYPCRIIVLCPEKPTDAEIALDAKLFSQCFLGGESGDQCCCEALVLGYGTNEVSFLENQLSVWLASDLPVYHWLHRASIDFFENGSQHLFGKARRIIFDSSIDGDAYREIVYSHSEKFSDLANARTARLRQSLGQFLASISPQTLAAKLREAIVFAQPQSNAEGLSILGWQKHNLEQCALASQEDHSASIFRLSNLAEEDPDVLQSKWSYEGENYLSWKLRKGSCIGWVDAHFDGHTSKHPVRADPFHPTKALAEALFFQ
ncbi:MAG: glucose-6-phosphate dehydrogenase assembly protein OpcA [Opitutales bacterium]